MFRSGRYPDWLDRANTFRLTGNANDMQVRAGYTSKLCHYDFVFARVPSTPAGPVGTRG